jgi:hypothetical protein
VGKLAGGAFEIGELAIAPFGAQAAQIIGEKFLVLHYCLATTSLYGGHFPAIIAIPAGFAHGGGTTHTKP